ncbi:MAG: Gfo/Idh/MocA family oxidoreductase [Actinomycetota bacterium]|nr:Gfo/Idh/MocA family oxidoreductase [Actinomycetota bacterium]
MIAEPIRWGILGTAGIAESSFLPALRQAGDGVAVSVASRDGPRARSWATDHGVARGVAGYEQVVADPEIEAIYIPLPNGLHAEWTIAALEAGKAVLCEKPLCVTPEETRRVLATADAASVPLWEAFVFPFHQQMERIQDALAAGQIGQVREIVSRFHFVLDDPQDIRLSGELGGGSLFDVGCYPIRLARLLFDAEPDLDRTIADAVWTTSGVDTELWGALTFPGDRRLVFSCGFVAAYDTFTRVFGTEGEIRITNPFHPGRDDTFAIVGRDDVQEHPAAPTGELSFTAAIRHIHAVLRGREEPSHLAVDEAMGNAAAIAALLAAADRPPA